jgi:DNA modification methylase
LITTKGDGWLNRAPSSLLKEVKPYYKTKLGAAYLGNSLNLVRKLPGSSIDLILTSPPFALLRQKDYKHPLDFMNPSQYIKWFMPYAKEFHRILKPEGSLVLHLGGAWNSGRPTKSLYQFDLLLKLCSSETKKKRFRFSLAQDFYWFNTAKFPSPAQWVTVNRIRVKDSVDAIWWLCKDSDGLTKADNSRALWEYSESMKDLLRRATYDSGHRPSGYDVSPDSFLQEHKGAIPPNLLPFANTGSNGPYLTNCKAYGIPVNPARFPADLPAFFIDFLTQDKNDVILDPFAGSNTTGWVAEEKKRSWLAFEVAEDYLKGSRFRFWTPAELGFPTSNEILAA